VAISGTEGVRLAELMAALSVATDIGLGGPQDHAQRSALLAVRLAEAAHLPEDEAQDAFYMALLKTIGCTGDDDVTWDALGEDMGQWAAHMGGAAPPEALALMFRNVGRGQALPARAASLLRAFTRMPAIMAASATHCELGQILARRLGLRAAVVRGLGQVFERWDGGGRPHKLKGEAIDRAVRIAGIVTDAEILHGLHGTEAAVAILRRRAGGGYDPKLVEQFCAGAAGFFASVEVPAITEAVLAAEPGRPERLAGERLDAAIRAMGEYGDMRSRYTRGHSAGVAALAAAAARGAGRPAEEERDLARAGHLHDLGRVGVLLRIWDKEGPLNESEWERVRMHTYYTERILSRIAGLGEVSALAALAHERLDGGGYHRRLPASAMPVAARLLAAADAYHAMTEARPHRPALSPEQAAGELRRAIGALDRDAVEAVLAAAGHETTRTRAPAPAGLSERELEVLRLVARGLTNKEVASRLEISAKTAGHHVQHIFEKIGVTTRAAAGLFAMQNDLLPPA
jgi:HD-GYP domain-containing protein (c-di-GMP phosphodiesterase class II)